MSGEGSRVGSGRGLYTMIQLSDAPFHRLILVETGFHGWSL